MAIKYKTRAIIFKKEERNESDRDFLVFTDDFGRLDIHAKAIRKITSKLRGGIDIFSLSEIEFVQGRNQKTLTDAVTIKKFKNILGDFNKLKIVFQIADVLDNFIKGEEKDKETFNLLSEVFNRLDDSLLKIKNDGLAYQYFLWNFVSLQGYKSEVNNCASCRLKLSPYAVYFSGKEGGIVCGDCANKREAEGAEFCIKINSDVVKILRLIFKKDWDMISKLKIGQTSQKILSDLSENAISAFCPAHC
jgi:DNA repair protein RecO (recombination protein O)